MIRYKQSLFTAGKGWEGDINQFDRANLVLIFGARQILEDSEIRKQIISRYPNAQIAGCSTAGEIYGTEVTDNSIVVTAVSFESTTVQVASESGASKEKSFEIGQQLAQKLNAKGLRHLFVLSEGLNINGSSLVQGLTQALPSHVTITGGLSGDGADFQRTVSICNEICESNLVTAIGFYGDKLTLGYASLGGWDPFGPERKITRSEGNILYELDNEPALSLYQRYLGPQAAELPASGLLFPLAIRSSDSQQALVRTILAINEQEKSITFAGDVPIGYSARLMKANFDRLIDGAMGAATASASSMSELSTQLAILISCVGRKLILKQRVEEEVEAVRDVLGPNIPLTGFYSYGEISPFTPNAKCELHNQTMTITTLSEK
jgi:hypothetical protein